MNFLIALGAILAMVLVLNFGLGWYANKIERNEKKNGFKEY